ncbi:MAG: translation initiation factor IF-2 [Leptospiraceae bacterium]|nr:translation initiation factor IF-2 [Leptospiraceae bacterium]MDW7976861.1 translation initiation factor IF-2 [Leptospiraceae bacterium]
MAESSGKKIKVVVKGKTKDKGKDLPSDITDVFREGVSSKQKNEKTIETSNTIQKEISLEKKNEQKKVILKSVKKPPELPSKNTTTHEAELEAGKEQKPQEPNKKEEKERKPAPEPIEQIEQKEETQRDETPTILQDVKVKKEEELSELQNKKPLKKIYHHKVQEEVSEEKVEVRSKKQQKEQESERIFNKKNEQRWNQKDQQKKKDESKDFEKHHSSSIPKEITITESIQVSELAKKLNVKPSEIIARLMKLGEMVTINQVLDADTAAIVASEFGTEVKVVSLFEETIIKEDEDRPEDRVPRPPVVTIMGHVDHGKTKLLDVIRKSNVAEKEAGAITQHIGAYQVTTPKGKITFLDTPGHEAFTAMRARGASITDIVVLVVAADDGVKEQTIEAIHHAQAANVPIIVAINKIDLPTANPEKVRKELVQYGLQPEEWGGDTIFCEISAKNNIGIDNLLDMILLQAEMMELKANPKVRPVGRVIESKKDPGKGPVATILIQKGTLKEGDPFVVGIYAGKVRAMFDDYGRRLQVAEPSTPIEIIGIEDVPEPGDPFHVVESEKEAREIAAKRKYYKQITQAKSKQPTWKDLDAWTKEHKELKVIIKADVHGSVEAIRDGLMKLSTEDVKVNVIYGAAGPITESDVNLALASNALIVSFQVRATPKAQEIAEQNNVEIRYYSIIYNLLEDIEKAMKGLLEPKVEEVVSGEAEVRQVFRIAKVGNVAGCMVRKGKISRNERIRIIRDGIVVYDGEVLQIKRFKEDVSEVAEGFECGISIKGYNDIKEGDVIEFYKVVEVVKN